MRILNFGSLNIDYVYHVPHFVRPGETLRSSSLQVNCGGKGLNQSVALARAGAEVWHAGCIGAEGQFLREKLDVCGVNTSLIRQVDGSTGHAVIQVDSSGQNSILLHTGANGMVTPDFAEEVLSHFSPGDVVLLQNEISCLREIMDIAEGRGLRLALNAAPADEALKDLPLEKLSWLLVNETEGAFLAGKDLPGDIADVLSRRYPRTAIVLTLGTDGSVAALGEQRIHVPARVVDAVDTTAAGDTFTGYFLRRILDGGSLQEALTLATAASAITVTRPGAADSIPDCSEVII